VLASVGVQAVAKPEKKLAGATSNDRPNQNGKHTNSYIQILQLRKFYAKFVDVTSNLKNKNTNQQILRTCEP
jgi:hypothetical protein